MSRRNFFGVIGGVSVIPFVGFKLRAKPTEAPYEEPFQGYDKYIRRLVQKVGEIVRIQDSFSSTGSDRRKLLEVERFDNPDGKLFPHRVSFDDGLSINLSAMASITSLDENQWKVNPRGKGTFYLHIPGQAAHEEYMNNYLETLERRIKRFD